MSTTRREFLQTAVAGGTLLGLQTLVPSLGPRALGAQTPEQTKEKLRILMLGGTSFLGPHTVRAALARGHEVTLFNRGKTNPQLFPELEKLRGDRYGDMSALEGRKWDAVVDTFAYVPSVVTNTAKIIGDNVKQYVLISTVSVYRAYTEPGMDENGELATVPDDVVTKVQTHREVGENYGGFKALCERAAEEAMPGRVCTVRPGLIVGPDDPSDRFTYWPVRVARGGEILSPGTPKDFIQFIDVRDLADFIVLCMERRIMAIMNADSPAGSVTIGGLLDACKEVSGSDARFTWVPSEFLAENGVQAWSDMPVWVPAKEDYKGFGQVSTERATKAGLKHRPIPDTVRDTLKWFGEQPEERQKALRAGIKPEREVEVLAAWHKHEEGG